MTDPSIPGPAALAILAAASVAAGAVNSVAGGGTILTFPVLTWILPGGAERFVVANATSTVGIWPGAAAAAWAYRGERSEVPAWSRWLLVPSVGGAIAGALLVLWLPPETFAAAVPWLILAAAVLFAAQPWLARVLSAPRRAGVGTVPTRGVVAACVAQFLVALYGGYFGAGIGILMLAVLGLLGLGDIHRLNGVKNALGMVVNGAAAALFAAGPLAGRHDVSWPCVAVMAAGSIGGGLAGSALARRLPAPLVRRGVAVIAFTLAAWYLWRPGPG